MDAVKENFCLFNELLYSLMGYHGTSFSNFKVHSTFKQSYDLNNPLIQDLIQVSKLYLLVNKYLYDYSIYKNEYTFLIYELLNNVINYTYRSKLVKFDYYGRYKNEHIYELSQFLKHKYIFTDILNILNEINNDNKTLALFKLSNLFEHKYDLKFDYDNDPFFQAIWSWITRGKLPVNLNNDFFITMDSHDNFSLDFSKFPDAIEPTNAIMIHNIGNLIRTIRSHNITFNINLSSLYWKYYDKRKDLYQSSVQFKDFLLYMKKIIFENILEITKLKQTYFEYINHLKTFYLFGNEYFWINFQQSFQSSNADSNSRTIFINALYSTFDDSMADYYQSFMSVKMVKHNKIQLRFNLKQVPLLSLIITNDSLIKYQSIFNYIFILQNARHKLVDSWKDDSISTNKHSYHFFYLRSSLFRSLTIFYMYTKFVIEYMFKSHQITVEPLVDVDEIQITHQAYLLDIINQLFIKNNFIFSHQNALIKICQTLTTPMNQDIDFDKLIEEYNLIMKIIRDSFKSNQKHIKLFYEILESI